MKIRSPHASKEEQPSTEATTTEWNEVHEANSSNQSSTIMSQASRESSSKGDLSMPYCDESDLVPSKTNLQLYWDYPPSPTGSERNVATNLTGSLKSLLSEHFSRTFTALIVPRPRNQFQDGRSEDEEIEPLIS